MRHRTVICVLLSLVPLIAGCGLLGDGQEPSPTRDVALTLAISPTPTATPEPAAPVPSTAIDYEPTQKKKTPTTLEGHPNLAPSDKMEHSPAPRVSQPQTLATT